MSVWSLIAILVVGTIAVKVLGPVVVGGREPPAPVVRVIGLLAPALIAALIVTSSFTTAGRVVLDARAVGLVVGGLALWFRAPLFLALVLGVVSCAVVRLLS